MNPAPDVSEANTRVSQEAEQHPHPPVRYIKLGRQGAWVRRALDEGVVYLGHNQVPHDLGLQRDQVKIAQHLVGLGRPPGTARSHAREVVEFYGLGDNTIWITFVHGDLWWARAEPEVVWIGGGEDHGARFRRTIGGWSNKTRAGKPLSSNLLSTKLTKVAAFRQTLCRVEASDYLLRKLNGFDEPTVLSAREARSRLLVSASALIADLHWADFETLIDILFARSGWHRTSVLGETMRDADLVVEQVVTRETGLVQVKSAATQATLDQYIARFDEAGLWRRMFFVCHSPKGTLTTGGRDDVHVWTRDGVAERVLSHGLFDWLVARVA